MMNTVVKYVLNHIPSAKLVLYSDDIACIARDSSELRDIHRRLTEGLAYFNMKFDNGKSQFIRFGNCTIPEITLQTGQHFLTLRPSDSVKYLGFYLKDGIGVDISHHVEKRCSVQGLA